MADCYTTHPFSNAFTYFTSAIYINFILYQKTNNNEVKDIDTAVAAVSGLDRKLHSDPYPGLGIEKPGLETCES